MGLPHHRRSHPSAGFRAPPRRARSWWDGAALRHPKRANNSLIFPALPAPPGLRAGPHPCSPRALLRNARWHPLLRQNPSSRHLPTRPQRPTRPSAPPRRPHQPLPIRIAGLIVIRYRICPGWVHLPGAPGAAIRGAGLLASSFFFLFLRWPGPPICSFTAIPS